MFTTCMRVPAPPAPSSLTEMFVDPLPPPPPADASSLPTPQVRPGLPGLSVDRLRLLLQQEPPERIAVLVVVVYKRNEPPLARDVLEQLPRRRQARIEEGPLRPDIKRFFLLVSLTAHPQMTLTFHARNDVSSMIVLWTISCPGKTPHVTALTASPTAFVTNSPALFAA